MRSSRIAMAVSSLYTPRPLAFGCKTLSCSVFLLNRSRSNGATSSARHRFASISISCCSRLAAGNDSRRTSRSTTSPNGFANTQTRTARLSGAHSNRPKCSGSDPLRRDRHPEAMPGQVSRSQAHNAGPSIGKALHSAHHRFDHHKRRDSRDRVGDLRMVGCDCSCVPRRSRLGVAMPAVPGVPSRADATGQVPPGLVRWIVESSRN